MTQDDVDSIMTALTAGGVFADDPLGAGKDKTRQGLQQLVGAAWTDANIKLLAGAFGVAASQTPGTNIPIDVPGALTGLGNTLTQLVTYALALALVGLGIFLYSKGGSKQEAAVVPPGY